MPLPSEISCHEVKRLLDDGVPLTLVDCREPDEHALVSLSAAMLVPTSNGPAAAAQRLAAYRHDRLIIFCHVGMRSSRLADWLRSLGFDHAQSMSGGIDRWAAEIEPGMTRY